MRSHSKRVAAVALAGALALGAGVSVAGGTAWIGQVSPSGASGDAAPRVTAVTMSARGVLTIRFSERVRALGAAFRLACPPPARGARSFALSSSPAASYRLTPRRRLPVGTSCRITIRSKRIHDVDRNDPPDTMRRDHKATVRLLSTAVADAATLLEDAAATSIPVLSNDRAGSKSIVTVSSPPHGTVTITGGGKGLTYAPAANYCGPDTFTYTLNDGSTGAVTVAVTCVNDAPVPADEVYTTNEDATLTVPAPGVLGNDSDVEGAPLSAMVDTAPGHGTLALNADGSFAYTPSANFNGADSFAYRASDGSAASEVVTVSLTVGPLNDAPSFDLGPDQMVVLDSGPQTVAGFASNISAGAANESGQTSSFQVSNTNNALFAAQPEIGSTGTLTYTSAAGATGKATVSVTLSDDGGTANGGADTSVTKTFNITVRNATPVARSQTSGGAVAAIEDTVKQITLTATDADGDAVKFSLAANPGKGSLGNFGAVNCTGNPSVCTQTLEYVPAANENGPDSFTFTADDGLSSSPPATVAIDITTVNDAPNFVKGADESVPEDPGARTVSGWALPTAGPANESGQSVTFEITNNTNAALFSVAPAVSQSGDLTYTPVANAFGSATITLRLHDSGGTADGGVDTSATQTFQIVVLSVNDAPSFTKGANQTFDEDSGAHTIAGWATGVSAGPANESGQSVSVVVTNNTKPGLFSAGPSVGSNGTLSYTPAANQNGTATITLKAIDDGGTANGGVDESPTGSFTITINALNDAPTSPGRAYGANSLQANMQRSLDQASGLLAGARDADDVAGNPGYSPTFTVASLNGVAPTGGTITTTIAGFGTVVANAATGAFTIDPQPGVTGNFSFNYTICDSGEGTPASQCTGTLTASFNIAGPVIWFVNSAAATNGSGTLTSPFNTLAAADAVDAANHGIFLYSSATGYTGAFALNAGEQLIGQSTTGTTFDAVFGISTPTGTATPTLGSGTATLTGTVTLASGVKLRGLSLATGASDALVGSGGLTSVDVDQTSIASDTGTALSLNDVSGTVTLADLDKNGAGTGISLTNVGASVTVASGATISATTTAAVDIDQGTGSFRYAGTIRNFAGRTVEVTNRNTASPGLVQFTGSVTGSGGTGINLDNNDNGTVTFSGGLVVFAGCNPVSPFCPVRSPAFNAVNGGTVNVTGAANTLSAPLGTALNVTDTTIGASGLTFKSISAGGDLLGFVVNGIVLNNTGSSGGLTVTGDGNASLGGNGSGGVIKDTIEDGISLTNTLSPSFTNMTIQGSRLESGIRGTQVTNFTFANGTIDNIGDFQNPAFSVDESDIRFDDHASGTERNLSGTVTITNNVLNNAVWHGIDIANFSGTISDLDISGNSLTSGTRGGSCSDADRAAGRFCSNGDAIKIGAFGSATTAANITKGTIADNVIANFPGGAGIVVSGGNSSATGPGGTVGTPGNPTNIVAITGNRIAGQGSTSFMGDEAIFVGMNGGNSASRSQANFDVSNNGTVAQPLANMSADAINVANAGYATMTARVINNVLFANTFGAVGIRGGNAPATGPTETPDLTLAVTGNTVNQASGSGIYLFGGTSGLSGGGTSGIAKFGVRDNTVGASLSGFSPGIRVDAGGTPSGDDAVCLDIRSNKSVGTGGSKGIGLSKQGTTSTTNDFGIEGMAATATPGVEQYVDGLNPSGGGTTLISATSGFSNCDTAP